MRPIRTSRLVLIFGCVMTGVASAQVARNPVYPDDSTLASDTLAALPGLVSTGNTGEALRALQKLLDDEPERVLASIDDPDLFVSVRDRVHAHLLASPDLLASYREQAEPVARQQLERGLWLEVERSRLLTPSGFEAALRVAQLLLEDARFEAALRTIRQLDEHPDRTSRGREATELLALIASYVDRDDAWALVTRWSSEAGLDRPERRFVEPPPETEAPVRHPLGDACPDVELRGIVPSPLKSVELTESTGEPAELERTRVIVVGARQELRAFAWSLPTVRGDDVFVNDGTTISAWDRFTLRPKWRIRTDLGLNPGADPWRNSTRRTVGRRLEDCATVAVEGRYVLTTTGHAMGGTRDGDGRVHALDRMTGKPVWSVDVSELDPQLEEASVRGPLLVEGDTVIVGARKSVRSRRLVSLYLVGLDLRSGAMRWLRPIASAGSLPFQQFGRLAEGGVVSGGVVFRADEIGIVGAIDAATGRPLWVRRLPAHDLYASDLRAPWNTTVPIIDRDTIVMLSPDRREILRLHQGTGRIVARRLAAELGSPHYLVRIGDALAAVSSERVAFVNLARFDTAVVRLSRVFGAIGFTGRAVAAGQRLLVPVVGGVVSMDPAAPAMADLVPLDRTGNIVALEGQLIAVDEFDVHSYLVWDIAAGLLEGRMAESPDDPGPAATFAELAYRAGRADRIVPALDTALAAIESENSERSRAAASRLFDSILAMIEASQADWFGEPEPSEEPAPVDTLDVTAPRIRDLGVLSQLVNRLGRVAESSEQIVSHRMVLGRLREASGEAALAIEAYQEILLDRSLAPVTWRGPQISVRAELEATRRIRRLVIEHGTRVYATFDIEAQMRARDLGLDATGDALEAMARRYPAASTTPSLWMRAALAHHADRPHAGVRALRAGLASAQLLQRAGQPVDQPQIGEIAGRLITQLTERGRAVEAGGVLESVLDTFPEIALTNDGSELDMPTLRDELGRLVARRWALPEIGQSLAVTPRPTLMPGYVLSPVSSKPHEPALDAALMVAPAAQGFDLAMLIPGEGEEPVQVAWSRPVEREPILLRLDRDAAYLYWSSQDGGGIERIDLASGEEVWRSRDFGRLVAALAPGDERNFITPLDGHVSPDQIVISLDAQTLVISDRAGRAAAMDLESGRLLWARHVGVGRVHDCDVSGGLVVIGGADVMAGATNRAPVPRIVALDARTGDEINRVDEISGQIRWLRVTDAGDLLAGLDTGLVSINLVEGRINWVMSDTAAVGTIDAWTFGDRLFLLSDDRALWLGSAATGRLRELPLDDRGRMASRSRIDARRLGDRFSFASSTGVVIFSDNGELVGVDALDQSGLVPAAATEHSLVTLEPNGRSRSGMARFRLHLLSTDSARLQGTYDIRLLAQPSGITAIGGAVLITAGNATMVIGAPVEPH